MENFELKKGKVQVQQVFGIALIVMLVILVIFFISLTSGPQDSGKGYALISLLILGFLCAIPVLLYLAWGSFSKLKQSSASLPKTPSARKKSVVQLVGVAVALILLATYLFLVLF